MTTEEKRKDLLRQSEIASLLRRSRIPDAVQGIYNFEGFQIMSGAEDAYRKALYYVPLHDDLSRFTDDEYDEKWQHTEFFTLMGPPGTGKTHLAIAIGIAKIKFYQEVVWYWQVEELLDALRLGFEKGIERGGLSFDRIMDICCGADRLNLLILDDLGVEKPSEWAQAKLDEIINARYMNKCDLVVTTNLALDQLPQRIASRLTEGDLAVLKGQDFRRLIHQKREKARGKI